MKKSLKILSFVISVFIFVSFVGNNRVKAVATGAVLGAEGISAAVSFLLSTIFTDSLVIAGNAAEQADYTVTVTTDEAQQILDDYFYSFNIDSLEGIDDYNCLMTITDPNQFLSYCGVSDPISLSGAQRTVYSSLQCTHNQVVDHKIITSAKGLVLQPISFSELLNDTSSDLISYFSKSDATVTFENGIRTLFLTKNEVYFKQLASDYGATAVYRDSFYFACSPNSEFFIYFIGTDSSGAIYFSDRVGSSSLNIGGSPHYTGSHDVSITINDSYFGFYYYNGSFSSVRRVYGLRADGSPLLSSSSDAVNVYNISKGKCFNSWELFHVYTLFFPTMESAQKLRDDIWSNDYTVDPDNVVSQDQDIFEIPFTDTEKKVDVYEHDHQGVDDIDIVIDPGAVKADDGTTTYNPSISVNDTPLYDIDVTGYLDLDDTLDRFQLPSSISTKFPFSLPFDIYNLFNVFSAEPVTPQFTVPLDMTSVGGEVYNIDIDLSDFDDVANIVRWLLYGLFLIGLIILTNKLIGRG